MSILIAMNVAIKFVPVRTTIRGSADELVKAADGVGAAAGMERNQNIAICPVIALREAHLVAELFKNPGPTERR